MTSVTTRELSEHAAEVLGRVEEGRERVLVVEEGREVAAVVSAEDAHLLERLEDLLDARDALEAIAEAEQAGTISLADLQAKLGL